MVTNETSKSVSQMIEVRLEIFRDIKPDLLQDLSLTQNIKNLSYLTFYTFLSQACNL